MTSAPSYTGLQAKILSFLGAGVSAEKVASAVGCDPSYISQLLADSNFAAAVSEHKMVQLQEATNRDARLDSLEDKLIAKVETALESPLAMHKPFEAIRGLQIINSLKRRGSNVDQTVNHNTTIVQLTLPAVAINKFVVDTNNQVVQTGEKTLVTIPSNNVKQLAEGLSLPSANESFNRSINNDRFNLANLD